MTVLTYVILALIAASAGAFVAWPVLRSKANRGRVVLAADGKGRAERIRHELTRRRRR